MTTRSAVLQVIRRKCLDCSVYQPAEVRECPVTRCALWPFRFGTDPEPSRTRGFAKASVYTSDLKARAVAGTPTAPSPSLSQNSPLHGVVRKASQSSLMRRSEHGQAGSYP
jgi:hypothetical protein